jgi:hypothetical protein
MSERLDQHRISFDLQRLNQMLHDFLMSFAPKSPEPEMETAIDWEDGEIEDQTEPTARR